MPHTPTEAPPLPEIVNSDLGEEIEKIAATLPPESAPSLEESLKKLKGYQFFHVFVEELKRDREQQFFAMRGAKKRELHEIQGAMVKLSEIIDMCS